MGGCLGKQGSNGVSSAPSHPPVRFTRKGLLERFGGSTINPTALFVFKTSSTAGAGQTKIFVNVFHHKKVHQGHCLVKDRHQVSDKKGESCIAYAVVVGDDIQEKCTNDEYKQYISERITQLVNNIFRDAQLDGGAIKLPVVKKGFMGDVIPFFSVAEELVVVHSWKDAAFVTVEAEPVAAPVTKPSPPASPTPASEPPPAAVVTPPVPTQPTVTATTAIPAPAAVATASGKNTPPVAPTTGSGKPPVAPAPVLAVSPPTGTSTASGKAPTPPPTVAVGAGTPPAAPQTQDADRTVSTSGRASVFHQQQPKLVDPYPALDIAQIPVPKRLTGWMKKQGHLAKTWKMRFFVLDHGFLTYYVDHQETPPYGVDKKGQICLAGYREKALMRRPESVNYMVPGSTGHNADFADASDGSEDEYDMADGEEANAKRIQLEFYPQIIDSEVLAELKRRNGDTSTYETHKEFLLICQFAHEREGWLAALEAHTTYIETIAMKYLQERNARSTALTVAGEGGDATPTNKPRSNSIVSALSFMSGNGRRESLGGANGGGGGRPISRASRHASITLASQKFSVFVNKDEKVVLMGLTEKPNPIGYRHLRQLLLVQRVVDPVDMANAAATGNEITCRKRLIYIDSNSYEKKGEILWIEDRMRYPRVTAQGDRLEIFDPNTGRTYVFFPKDDLSAETWAAEINNIPPSAPPTLA